MNSIEFRFDFFYVKLTLEDPFSFNITSVPISHEKTSFNHDTRLSSVQPRDFRRYDGCKIYIIMISNPLFTNRKAIEFVFQKYI